MPGPDYHGWTHANGIDPIGGHFTCVLAEWDETVEVPVNLNDCFFFHVPPDLNGTKLRSASASVRTPPSGGDLYVNVLRFAPDPTGTFVLLAPDPIQVDDGDYTSFTSAVPVSFSDYAVNTGEFIFLCVGDSFDAKGLVVHLYFA